MIIYKLQNFAEFKTLEGPKSFNKVSRLIITNYNISKINQKTKKLQKVERFL